MTCSSYYPEEGRREGGNEKKITQEGGESRRERKENTRNREGRECW